MLGTLARSMPQFGLLFILVVLHEPALGRQHAAREHAALAAMTMHGLPVDATSSASPRRSSIAAPGSTSSGRSSWPRAPSARWCWRPRWCGSARPRPRPSPDQAPSGDSQRTAPLRMRDTAHRRHPRAGPAALSSRRPLATPDGLRRAAGPPHPGRRVGARRHRPDVQVVQPVVGRTLDGLAHGPQDRPGAWWSSSTRLVSRSSPHDHRATSAAPRRPISGSIHRAPRDLPARSLHDRQHRGQRIGQDVQVGDRRFGSWSGRRRLHGGSGGSRVHGRSWWLLSA